LIRWASLNRIALLRDTPFFLAGPPFHFPKPHAAEERIFVFSLFDPLRKLIEAVHKSAAEDDVISDKGKLQLCDGEDHFAFPFLLAE